MFGGRMCGVVFGWWCCRSSFGSDTWSSGGNDARSIRLLPWQSLKKHSHACITNTRHDHSHSKARSYNDTRCCIYAISLGISIAFVWARWLIRVSCSKCSFDVLIYFQVSSSKPHTISTVLQRHASTKTQIELQSAHGIPRHTYLSTERAERIKKDDVGGCKHLR
jgi:hypothetical protein